MKKIIVSVSVILILVERVLAQTGYLFIIQNVNLTDQNIIYHFPGDIISTGNPSQSQVVDGTSNVEFLAGHSVELKPGFHAQATNQNFHFHAAIEPPVECVLISPDPVSHIDANGVVHVNKWEKLEIGFTMPTNIQQAIESYIENYHLNNIDLNRDLNPFADDSLQIQIHINTPSGDNYIKWAFYMEEAKWDDDPGPPTGSSFTMSEDLANPLHKYKWRFRFSPDVVSSTIPWTFDISIFCPYRTDLTPNLLQYSLFSFICDPPLSTNKGWLHVNTSNHRYLQFDNGDSFFGIGENMCGNRAKWNYPYYMEYHKSDYDNYAQSLDETASAGGNYVSMHLDKFSFAPEWDDLGYYRDFHSAPACPCWTNWDARNLTGNRQLRAWTFDKIVDKLAADNIYCKLYIQSHVPGVAYQTFDWGDNAYVRKYAQSSNPTPPPCNFIDTKEIFKTSTVSNSATEGAMYYWKRLYKYILSRWGYSPNIPVIEPWREIDQELEYNTMSIGSAGAVGMCDQSTVYNEDSDLRDAIDFWYNTMLSYIRAQGGLNDTNHLFKVSYTHFEWPETTPSYNRLFGNQNIDITDVHSYGPIQSANSDRLNIVNKVKTDYPDKPFHFGEAATFGTDATGLHLVDQYFNNYDISFHNELWSTAFTGSMATSQTWLWELVHRWPTANPTVIGPNGIVSESGELIPPYSVIDQFGNSGFLPSNVSIKKLYHNFRPLADFISTIDFNSDFTPHKSTNYWDTWNPADVIEAYYLIDNNQSNIYGWIHNINKYWANSYFYTSSDETYYLCDRLPYQPASTYTIDGFLSNSDYYIQFFKTRMGTYSIPNPQTVTSDGSGNIILDFSTAPLSCDTSHADYAFSATLLPMRRANNSPNSSTDTNESVIFSIYPNPATGLVTFVMPISNDQNSVLSIYDISGRLIKIIKPSGQRNLVIDFSIYSRGVYLIRYQNSRGSKVKRLIIN